MIGISVYLSKENEEFNRNWIEKAANSGFSSIFTSLHIPEDDPSYYKELLLKLGQQAKNNKMELFADISPESLKHLDIDTRSAYQLLEWGVTGLRVDYGFNISEIVSLSKKIKISLNASTLTEELLNSLIKEGINTKNTEAAHNFYPRPETGLSKNYLIQKNKLIKSFGINVSAFISGDGKKRGPLYQGLPTLESHRYLTPINSYLDLAENCFIDSIYVGDPSLSVKTLKSMALLKESVIPIRYTGVNKTEFEDFHRFLEKVQSNRLDPARDVIRIENSRVNLHNNNNLKPNNTVTRTTGSITVDNHDYGRYAGEIHITLRNLESDSKVNVIGRVIEEDLPLLSYVHGGQKFLLLKIN